MNSGYSAVNGINMYYELHGQGRPLVLIHGGGSTIDSTFGRVIPMLAKRYYVIAIETQAHGRTSDRPGPESFEQDADDVAELLAGLGIRMADIFGFSNGGTTAIQLALRHSELVGKLVLASPLSKRSGLPAEFWGFMEQASLENMPTELKESYLKVSGGNVEGLQIMHDKDAARMVHFKDIPDELIASINAPTLIIVGDRDVILPEHALYLHRSIAGSALAIIPGLHGEYIEEITTLPSNTQQARFVIPMIENFLG